MDEQIDLILTYTLECITYIQLKTHKDQAEVQLFLEKNIYYANSRKTSYFCYRRAIGKWYRSWTASWVNYITAERTIKWNNKRKAASHELKGKSNFNCFAESDPKVYCRVFTWSIDIASISKILHFYLNRIFSIPKVFGNDSHLKLNILM